MKKWLWLAVMFVVIGCGNNRPEGNAWPAIVLLSDGFSDTQKVELKEIADELNTLTGHTLVADASPTNFSISITLVDPPETKRNRAGFATLTDVGCEIQLSKFLYEENKKDFLRAVLLHEMGHCAGLDHTTEPESLMYPTTNRYSDYKPEALQQFAQQVLKALGKQ